MNIRFVLRGTLLALPAAVLLAGLGLYRMALKANPPGPTPPPPTILAPRGPLPAGPAGLTEWARFAGEAYARVGCGFLLGLEDGQIIGVTTAHSLGPPDPARPLERIAFGIAGAPGYVIEFDTVLARGVPRTGGDLTVDFVLLTMPMGAVVDPALVLDPDPRGAPQPGERVSMFSGLGDGDGGARAFEGTVYSVNESAAWVLMDETFDPGGMSGSPVLSQHTGRVVGMAIAVAPRGGRVAIGLNPVAAIVDETRP